MRISEFQPNHTIEPLAAAVATLTLAVQAQTLPPPPIVYVPVQQVSQSVPYEIPDQFSKLGYNCIAYVHYLNPRVPQVMPNKLPNNTFVYAAEKGDVLVMRYPHKGTGTMVWHAAMVKKILENGDFLIKESNFKAGVIAERVVSQKDKAIKWVYSPAV